MEEDFKLLMCFFGCSTETLAMAARNAFDRAYPDAVVIISPKLLVLHTALNMPVAVAHEVEQIQRFVSENCSEQFFFYGYRTDPATHEILRRRFDHERAGRKRNRVLHQFTRGQKRASRKRASAGPKRVQPQSVAAG